MVTIPRPQSRGIKKTGPLRLGVGYLGFNFLVMSLGVDLRLWATSGSWDLVQTAHLAACNLGRGPRPQLWHSRAGAGVFGEAARWCWSPGSRAALKGTPDSTGIPRELFERSLL